MAKKPRATIPFGDLIFDLQTKRDAASLYAATVDSTALLLARGDIPPDKIQSAGERLIKATEAFALAFWGD